MRWIADAFATMLVKENLYPGGTMALPTNIKTLLGGNVVEWARIEFKETWDPQSSLKTICAFANDVENWGGGYIVIGVSDQDGRPKELKGVPQEKVDAYLKDILNKCKLIQPDYMPITEVAEHEGRLFIAIWAPGGSQRPYSSPKTMGKKASERVYWIRKMASTISPTEAQKRDLYDLANNIPFDDRVNHEADISDLNLSLIKGFLKEVDSSLYHSADVMDFVELCRSMNIVAGPDEYTKPKNVALMFFSMEPRQFFPYAQIDIVELPEGESGDVIVEKTFSGPIQQQLRDALLYLKNNVIEETIIKRDDIAEAQRYFNYPYAALEEALANAVYHKGYDSREPIEVRILPDRIEILSHPGADRSISIKGLKEFRAISRRYRNRRVGEFLKELRLTEGRNTGMHKILRSLQENGSPKPLFETDEERLFFLTTIFKKSDSDCPKENGEVVTSRGIEKGKVEKRREAILRYLAENPTAKIDELSDSLKISRATAERDLKSLRSNKRLQRTGSSRSGKWIVS